MKRSMLALLVVLSVSLALVGCQNENAQLTGPDNPTGYTPRLIEMPKSAALQKTFQASASISAANGGTLAINAVDPTDPASLSYDISLVFEANTISTDMTASISTDSKYLMYWFEPHGTNFNKPAKLSVTVKGVDLNWVKPGDVLYLWYQGQYGWEKMPGTVTYDVATGTVQCLNGELPHFSRYGFGI
jgi:hypothetical protein